MTPEGEEKWAVKTFLAAIKAYQFWPVQTGLGAATVDCLACVRGHFFAIEVKKRGYVPSDFTTRQLVILETAYAAGASAIGGDAEEIIREIRLWDGTPRRRWPAR